MKVSSAKVISFSKLQTLALTDNVLKASEKESGKKLYLFYGSQNSMAPHVFKYPNVWQAPLNLFYGELLSIKEGLKTHGRILDKTTDH